MTTDKTWGGARKGAGRKKGSSLISPEDLRIKRIVVLVTPKQEIELKALAKASGKPLSTFLLEKAFQ